MSEATHQVKHPPTCMHIHLLFTGGLKVYLLFVKCVEMKTCYACIHKHNAQCPSGFIQGLLQVSGLPVHVCVCVNLPSSLYWFHDASYGITLERQDPDKKSEYKGKTSVTEKSRN